MRDEKDRFVETLTKDDFEITEDGNARPIEQMWVVNLPTDQPVSATVGARSPLAVVGSTEDAGRLYVLVLGSGPREHVQTIARQFITGFLGPSDLMAVVHVINREASQGLSSKREELLASVDNYRGGGGGESSLAMLKEVAVSLTATTGRRKAVLFIDAGFDLWPTLCAGGSGCADQVDAAVAARKTSRVFEDVIDTARRNNVRIYPISPQGWMDGDSSQGFALQGPRGDKIASLRIMAADTGGLSIANTNNYRGNFPEIVRDTSSYYLLTYVSAAEDDGRSHPITVRLRNRPGFSVRQGRESFTSLTPDVRGRSARMPIGLSAQARDVLAAAPGKGPSLELLTAVFQSPDHQGSILIGAHVPGALLQLASKETIELSYLAMDRWGVVRAVERRAFTLNLNAQTRDHVERTGLRLFGRLQVPRGQYQIRVAAHQANGTTGSAAATIEVPDFAGQSLTISDFVLASSRGPALLTLEEDPVLRRALPSQPTPVRRFEPGDVLTVFTEIYDSHWIVSQEVGVTMTVTAADGRQVFRAEQVLTAANRGRFYLTGQLALRHFAPGEYQVLVEAHTRKGIPANTSKQMGFTVRAAETLPSPDEVTR